MADDQFLPAVVDALRTTPFIDMHTHLYAPTFGRIGLWGIDELLTYHYLEAELFRYPDLTPERYWSLSKRKQADAIWRTLFVENTPISEACRGIVAVLDAFGLPTDSPDLSQARAFFENQKIDEHVDKVFELAGVHTVVMTNDPLDAQEGPVWVKGVEPDARFQAVLCLDRILREWSSPWQLLQSQGYKVDEHGSATLRKFDGSSPTGTRECSPCIWRYRYRTRFNFLKLRCTVACFETRFCRRVGSLICRWA